MIFIPKQPFMVEVTNSYYKYIVNESGISHFYQFKVNKGVDSFPISVPDGCLDLIIHFDPKDGDNIGADWYGTDLKPHAMKCYEGCEHFGVRFMPGVVPSLTGARMADFVEKIIPFADVCPKGTLIEEIATCKSFAQKIKVFSDKYQKYESKTKKSNNLLIYFIKKIVQYNGNISVLDLAKDSNYSVSYIDKLFKREMGISPKRFALIVRFQSILIYFSDALRNGEEVDYNDIINLCGFYDQAHMINVFKKFSNYSPNSYFKELAEFNYKNRLIEIS